MNKAEGQITQHIRYGLTSLPFGTLLLKDKINNIGEKQN